MIIAFLPLAEVVIGLQAWGQTRDHKELCLLCLILGGRLLIVRYTGHGLSGDDLNMGTPSVDRESLKCSGQKFDSISTPYVMDISILQVATLGVVRG